MKFKIQGVGRDGSKKNGTINATSEQEALQKAKKAGIFVSSISEVKEAIAVVPQVPQRQPAVVTPASAQGKKFCSNCGAPHNANQAICLKCGVAIAGSNAGTTGPGNKDKNVAGILALLLGTLGVHHFYHGSWGKGLVYILCTLTGFGVIITGILAFIESLMYFCGSKEKYDMKFNQTPPSPFK